MGSGAESKLGEVYCTMYLDTRMGLGTSLTLSENHWELFDAHCSLIELADFSIDKLDVPKHEIQEMFEEVLAHLKERK